jgi:hypothetical protein
VRKPSQFGRGVYRRGGRFQVQIFFDGKPRCLGMFDTLEAATEAYRAAAVERDVRVRAAKEAKTKRILAAASAAGSERRRDWKTGRQLPSVAYLYECFSLDHETGLLTWRTRPVAHFASARACRLWNARCSGKPAGTVRSNGYRILWLDGRNYRAHRVVRAICDGEWPTGDIDHADGCRAGNDPDNIRECSVAENHWNTGSRVSNRLGVKGISFDVRCGRYRARISFGDKEIGLGYFDTIEEAKTAYAAAVSAYRGPFARLVAGDDQSLYFQPAARRKLALQRGERHA